MSRLGHRFFCKISSFQAKKCEKALKLRNFSKKVLHFYFFDVYLQSQMRETNNRGVAQLASASGLGPEGPVFESQYPDKRAVDFQLLFFLFTFDSASFCPHFSLVSWMAHFQIKVPSIKTGLFVDGSMFLTTVSIKTALFLDRSVVCPRKWQFGGQVRVVIYV